MIDNEPGEPFDITAFDAPRDGTQVDRVVGGAMARIAAVGVPGPRAPEHAAVFVAIARWWYLGLAAAAMIGIAGGTLVILTGPKASDRAPDAFVEAQMVEWIRSGHVPNNGDLFAAFHGLGR